MINRVCSQKHQSHKNTNLTCSIWISFLIQSKLYDDGVSDLNNLPVLVETCSPSIGGDAFDVCSYTNDRKRETNHCRSTTAGEKHY